MNTEVLDQEPTRHRASFTELLGQLANNSAAVVHDEIELVIKGIPEKVRAVRSGVLTVAAGVVISFAAFLCLCAALIIELTSYMAPVIAAFVVGAGLALIGVVIALIGYREFKKSVLKT